MKVDLSSIVKLILLLGLGFVLIWFSIRGISANEWEEMRLAFKDLKYGWLFLSVFCGVLSHLSRSHRWQMMLEPLGKKPAFANCYFILMIGYIANLAFPRLGEAARVGLMQKYEGFSFEKVFGSVVIDRMIDVVTLIGVFAFVFIMERDRLGSYAQEAVFGPLMEKIGSSANLLVLGGFALVGLVLLWFVLKRMGLGQKAKKFIQNILEGFKAIAKLKNFPLFIFHSIFIWVMYFSMVYIIFFASEVTAGLTPMAGLACLVFGAFAVVATPGGIGAYPIIIQATLGLYGLASHLAYGFGTLAWVVQTFGVLIVGFICLIALPIFNRNAKPVHQG